VFVTLYRDLHGEQITDFSHVCDDHNGTKVRADGIDCFDESFAALCILGAEPFVDYQRLEAMAGAMCE
jgi:hypothetical protein